MNKIREVFEDSEISAAVWPSRSPDLTVCDFYLWDNLICKAYETNLHSLKELKQNIRNEIGNITMAKLNRVNQNVFSRYNACLPTGGRHFQRLL